MGEREDFADGMYQKQELKLHLEDEDVEWVVNDGAELGVKIGNQFFFLYKGRSIVYEDGKHDDGTPMRWRPVFKREFGECCHPVLPDYFKEGWSQKDRYTHGDDELWEDLPATGIKKKKAPKRIEGRIKDWRNERPGEETEGVIELLCDAEAEIRKLREEAK